MKWLLKNRYSIMDLVFITIMVNLMVLHSFWAILLIVPLGILAVTLERIFLPEQFNKRLDPKE